MLIGLFNLPTSLWIITSLFPTFLGNQGTKQLCLLAWELNKWLIYLKWDGRLLAYILLASEFVSLCCCHVIFIDKKVTGELFEKKSFSLRLPDKRGTLHTYITEGTSEGGILVRAGSLEKAWKESQQFCPTKWEIVATRLGQTRQMWQSTGFDCVQIAMGRPS